MKFYFDDRSSWKWMGGLWLAAGSLIFWLGTARIQLSGFGWIEGAAFTAGIFALMLSIYFLNMKRVVLYYVNEEGIESHEGPGRKRRKLKWEEIYAIEWGEETFNVIKADNKLETWQSDLLSSKDQIRLKKELTLFVPVSDEKKQ